MKASGTSREPKLSLLSNYICGNRSTTKHDPRDPITTLKRFRTFSSSSLMVTKPNKANYSVTHIHNFPSRHWGYILPNPILSYYRHQPEKAKLLWILSSKACQGLVIHHENKILISGENPNLMALKSHRKTRKHTFWNLLARRFNQSGGRNIFIWEWQWAVLTFNYFAHAKTMKPKRKETD